jgi:hypothetical protein
MTWLSRRATRPTVMEGALDALVQLPGTDAGRLADVRGLVGRPGAGLGWVVHKSTAVR